MTDESINPVLGYATRDADGVPEWNADAEAAISSGARPRELRKCFKNDNEAARYFGKSMSRRYSLEKLSRTCAGCGTDADDLVISLGWQAIIPMRAWQVSLRGRDTAAPFITFHAICESCLDSWGTRLNRYGSRTALVGYISVAIFLLGISVPVMRLFGLLRWRSEFSMWFLAVTMIISLLTPLAIWLLRVRIPRKLRLLIHRKDVMISHVNDVLIRDGTNLVSADAFYDDHE